MTTAQIVETSVTVNNNSPIQDYVHPDDQTQPTFNFKFSRLFSKNSLKTPENFIVLSSTTEVSTLISVEGVKAHSRSLNDEIPNI